MDFNKEVINITYKIYNDGVHSYSLTGVAETFGVITKVLIYVKIKVPQNEKDKSYQRELIRTIVDVEKALKGIHGNIFTKTIYESIVKSFDFEVKLPLQKVTVILKV